MVGLRRAHVLLTLLGILVSSVAPALCVAQEQPDVDFARDIFPVLQRSCIECHGSKKQEGGLRLDRRSDLLDSGTIEAGEPEQSELLRRISLPRSNDEVMPAVGEPLAKQDIAKIRSWIAAGGQWPVDFEVSKHWSYVAPIRPALPVVSDPGWTQSPIDFFVLQQLENTGLRPSPPASPENLVRRVYFDLIGLPPSPLEVDAFLDAIAANGSHARPLELLLDELMQRPEFGERWARPWLDLARYADSHGFQRDDLRDIWAYRDWVIQALNDDMPYDQFTIEQIAGDLLPNATESQRIATGFHRCTPTNVEAGSLPEETRIEQVIDRVNTTGAVWLGTTLECCQCHDHKYDPFSAEDYYRFLAFYNNTEMEADRANPKTPSSIKFNGPSMPLADPERDAQRALVDEQLAETRQQLKKRRQKLKATLAEWLPELKESLAQTPRTHPLTVEGFQSRGSTDSFELLDDGSVLLVGGDPPDKDTYTFAVETELDDIRGFRLEILRHDSLPGKGPGRGDPVRRNFVLNEFSVKQFKRVDSVDQAFFETKELVFSSASASFSQKNWDVSQAIRDVGEDDVAKRGWAISPKFDEAHWAQFALAEPMSLVREEKLQFSLKQNFGKARTIGRFRILAVTGNIHAEATPADIVELTSLKASELKEKQLKKLVDYRVAQDRQSQRLDTQLKTLESQRKKIAADTTLVMVEMSVPRETVVFERGDYRKRGKPVEPGTPSILHPIPEGPRNRLALARWLVSRDNPLVARVTVNRWWAELFGAGLVETVEDFGIKGELPSHPQLLDWLAVEFVDNGWSIKNTLKTIMLSATYGQSSALTPELVERDAENRLLARGPRLRMSAETIRDNALSIAGLLSLKKFGPAIKPAQPDGIWRKVGGVAYNYEVSPGEDRFRRGIYVVLKRGSPYPSFVNFDASARLACTVKRSRTNTPLQALTLLNDPVYVAAAKAFAKRVRMEQPEASLDFQLAYAFRLCTARQPTEAEISALRALYIDQVGEEDSEDARQRAWNSVATVLLNLHETITKD